MLAIQNFQQRLFHHYQDTLDLPPTYKFIHGNPVQPVVPLHTPQQGVMFIGAYPSARFGLVGPEDNVPVDNLPSPFSLENYFDGRRGRPTDNSKALLEAYLQPLGLKPEQCWFTNLVRIFLFKDSHLRQYRRLGCAWPEWGTHYHFETLARRGRTWLVEELALARPKLVITLGAEVAGILQEVSDLQARNDLLTGQLNDLWLDDDTVYPVIHLAHPGIVMPPASERSPWPRRHWDEHLPAARQIVERLIN